VNLIIPEGFRDALSISTETSAKLCMNFATERQSECPFPYQASIKGMLTKVPGFFFMSYRQAVFNSALLTSNTAYRGIMEDLFK
jgi:hypothetical protein